MGRILLPALLGAVFTVFALPLLGLRRYAVVGFFLAAAIVPFPILLWPSDVPWHHTGITYTSPGIVTYTVMLCVLFVAFLRNAKWNDWILGYTFLALLYLTLGLTFVWSGVQPQWAGALHWLFALVALGAGYQIGMNLTPSLYRTLMAVALFLITANGLVCIAQLSGLPLTLYPTQLAEQLSEGRPIGTFTHSSTPGKFVLVLLILVLPALNFQDRITRRIAWWCILLAVPLVAVTLARANLVGVVLAIVLWLFLERRSWAGRPIRILALICLFVASIPIVSATLDRFATDPGGGARAEIYRTGLTQLQMNLWAGTGPNFYAEDVGRWDPTTAAGFPLHNTLLYMVAELGLVGGILFCLPVFVVAAIAIMDIVRGRSAASAWSKSYLVTFPGLMIVALTGWGMLTESMLHMWYLAIGVAAGAILNGNSKTLMIAPTRSIDHRPALQHRQ